MQQSLVLCDCTVDSDVGMGDFLLKEGICKCVDNRTFDRTCLRTWNLACAIARLIVMLAWTTFASAGDFARVWTCARAIARVSRHGLISFIRMCLQEKLGYGAR